MVVIEKGAYQDNVAALFANKTILVTGATGFVGKVLIEKLLRSCSSLKKIYVIVRCKNGENIKHRLEQIFNNHLFDSVKQQHGAVITEKVEAISGDISAPNLGLSTADRRKLTEEVELIYHSAATIRFSDSLQSTILLNVRGTKLMVQLAQECTQLMVFCYVSTTFCHENENEIFEKFYPPPANPHDIIKLCEEMDEVTLEKRAKQIRGTCANNYSFSKALAENLVEECMETLPVIIQRPSVVTPIWREPIPGWTDNLEGATGLFIAGGKGVLRTLLTRNEYILDSCPVDMVAKKLIVNTFYYYTYRNQRVFNLLGPSEFCKNMKFKQIIKAAEYVGRNKMPFSRVLWCPYVSIRTSRVLYYLDMLLFQVLPSLFVDILLFLTGNKPFLMKIQKRIWTFNHLLDFYFNKDLYMHDESTVKIRNVLNPLELELFDTSYDGYEGEAYVAGGALYARRHIFKEPDEDIPAALERMEILVQIDYYCKLVVIVGISIYIYNIFLGC